MVVLTIRPALGGDRRRGKESQQHGVGVSRPRRRPGEGAELERLRLLEVLGLGHGPAIDGGLVGERPIWNIGDRRTAFLHAEPAVGGHLADSNGV